MNTNITNITVDLSTANNFGVIRAVQGDMRTRFVYITLLDNQVEYDFDRVYPVLRGTKPDGTTIFNVCSISEDNRIIVELSEQLLAAPGKITCEISLYSVSEQISEDKQVITSFPFTIFVSTAAFAPGAVMSTDEFTAIADVIGNNAVLQECLDDIVASRDAAKVSEINAKASEDAAAISKEAARESEIAAKSSETNAAQSEENASTSATNTANSAATAASKATEAADSASAAKISETNAKVSETKAESSQTAAADSAAAAETSENHAAQSADSAAESSAISAQKASAAALSATDAADSADLASQKAAEAADSALAASQEAMAAANAAASITDSAATAAQKATEAIDHAVKAESFTHGRTNTRENEDIDNAEYYYHQSKAISESMSGALRPIGTVAFADLPALSSAAEGDMYNISDQFTTNADFREGTGFEIPAGSNIYKTVDGKWDVLAGSPVTGVKGTAETSYRKGNVNITKENIGLGNVPNVSTNDQTPTFAQAEIRENIASGEKLSALLGKIKKFFSDLKTVAFTGSYSDLTNKPAIGNGTVTIEQAGVEKGTFTMNQSENVTIELTDTNTQTVTGIKGSAESTYRTGNINLTKANLGLDNVANERQYSASNPQPSVTGSSGSCTGNAATATTANNALAIAGIPVQNIDPGVDRTYHLGSNGGTNPIQWIHRNNECVGHIGRNGDCSYPMTFHWSGQPGQPTWLWGGEDGTNMYLYNPSSFNVTYANSAGSANSVAYTNVSGRPTFSLSGTTLYINF